MRFAGSHAVLRIGLAPWLAACVLACSGGSSAPGGTGGSVAAPSLASFLPSARGNRGRYRGAGGRARMAAVTDSSRGVVTLNGPGTPTMRLRVRHDQILEVDSQGHDLYAYLRAPLRTGARWQYQLSEGGRRIPCRAQVVGDGLTERIRGAELSGCVRLVRTCSFPRGVPFPEPTKHIVRETWCPTVGQVASDATLDPHPGGDFQANEGRERLVGMRVQGAPVLPPLAEMSCDDFIMVDADVDAACGHALYPVEPATGRSGHGRCVYVWEMPDAGRMRVSVRRLRSAATQTDLDVALHELSSGVPEPDQSTDGARVSPLDPGVFAFGVGSHVVTIEAGHGACPAAGARRLVPLVTSLLPH